MTSPQDKLWHVLIRVVAGVKPQLSVMEQNALATYLPELKGRIRALDAATAKQVLQAIKDEVNTDG